jgi:RHS repeat-associated protein
MTASNQVSGFSYDAAGNQMGIPGGGSYTYDAENHLVSTAGVNYTYDGDGERIEKSNGEIYWYTSGGETLDETDLSGNLTSEYVFFGGARIARRDGSGNIFYYLADHLGSSRVMAEIPAGQTTATLCYDADFYPFGGERAYTNTCQQNYKFTGKERDPESGLDNFEARYYGSSIARFTSPDDPGAGWNLADPQSLNLYAYVQDNPINDVDPTGHMTSVCFTAGHSPTTTSFAASGACGQATNPMDPASDEEDGQTAYITNADTGDPKGFGQANATQTQAAAQHNDTETPPAQGQNSGTNATPPPPSTPPATPPPATPQGAGPAEPATTVGGAIMQMSGGRGGGQQPKGERRTTRKPEFQDKPGKLPKGVRQNPSKPDRYQVRNPHTGIWIDKPSGWSPDTVKKIAVGLGAAGAAGAAATAGSAGGISLFDLLLGAAAGAL